MSNLLLDRVYRQVDQQGSGINEEKVRRYLSAIGLRTTIWKQDVYGRVVPELFATMDANRDNVITIDEWRAALVQKIPREFLGADGTIDLGKIRGYFQYFDTNRDQSVSFDEIYNFVCTTAFSESGTGNQCGRWSEKDIIHMIQAELVAHLAIYAITNRKQDAISQQEFDAVITELASSPVPQVLSPAPQSPSDTPQDQPVPPSDPTNAPATSGDLSTWPQVQAHIAAMRRSGNDDSTIILSLPENTRTQIQTAISEYGYTLNQVIQLALGLPVDAVVPPAGTDSSAQTQSPDGSNVIRNVVIGMAVVLAIAVLAYLVFHKK